MGTAVITFQQEKFIKFYPEALWVMRLHWIELHGSGVFNPDIELGCRMEQTGHLICYTARDKKELIGYAIIILNTDLHQKHRTVAEINAIYVLSNYRGKVGKPFIRYCTQNITADTIRFTVNIARDFSPVLKRCGYKEIERIFERSQ